MHALQTDSALCCIFKFLRLHLNLSANFTSLVHSPKKIPQETPKIMSFKKKQMPLKLSFLLDDAHLSDPDEKPWLIKIFFQHFVRLTIKCGFYFLFLYFIERYR